MIIVPTEGANLDVAHLTHLQFCSFSHSLEHILFCTSLICGVPNRISSSNEPAHSTSVLLSPFYDTVSVFTHLVFKETVVLARM